MKLKYESREFVTESFSCLWRLSVDTNTRKAKGKVFGVNTSKNGEVLTVHVTPFNYEWNANTSLDFIASHYEKRFFKCEGRFTPVKGLKRCPNKTVSK